MANKLSASQPLIFSGIFHPRTKYSHKQKNSAIGILDFFNGIYSDIMSLYSAPSTQLKKINRLNSPSSPQNEELLPK